MNEDILTPEQQSEFEKNTEDAIKELPKKGRSIVQNGNNSTVINIDGNGHVVYCKDCKKIAKLQAKVKIQKEVISKKDEIIKVKNEEIELLRKSIKYLKNDIKSLKKTNH